MNHNSMDQVHQKIRKIQWYHEFDLPNGLEIRSREPDTSNHRKLWSAIFSELDEIDFEDKTVLFYLIRTSFCEL